MTNPHAPRVLLVDDNAMASELLADFLSLSGIDVRRAGNGADALEQSAAFQPHAVIVDIVLPDTDGYVLAGRLRAQHADQPLRLIALSGLPRDPQRGDADIFDSWVEKPADPTRLVELVTPAA
ncbi:two component response regulator [Bordetella ansorpii]|uniref:Two component response regulator n=1 Tax=Bordetella ansorpii TaxID=288768 RepID=A0A157SPP4_9BORD|nr:response regulator [Bordetella ansorpii]SAI72274.1 two component response regulator [Bordetella ansorpii]